MSNWISGRLLGAAIAIRFVGSASNSTRPWVDSAKPAAAAAFSAVRRVMVRSNDPSYGITTSVIRPRIFGNISANRRGIVCEAQPCDFITLRDRFLIFGRVSAALLGVLRSRANRLAGASVIADEEALTELAKGHRREET